MPASKRGGAAVGALPLAAISVLAGIDSRRWGLR